MPCFRGLDVSVSVQPHAERLPEFPHPDGSSVRVLLSLDSSAFAHNKRSSVSALSSNRLQKANPRVSVYVPSIAGTQFMIEYAVLRSPEPACQFFFKMFVNGRHITSWGVNPVSEPSGTVSRALYEPCERWQYEGHGAIFRAEGIESRSFFFSPSQPGGSVADDGGLIEVHVYRARGRRRRAIRLERFRSQDRYGILSLSSGLLEHPEATTYFDWDLIDPKDSPFATFRFHYRDLGLLQQLSLVPSESQDLAEAYPLSPITQESTGHHENDESFIGNVCGPEGWALDSSRTSTPLTFSHAISQIDNLEEAEAEASLSKGKRLASSSSAKSPPSRTLSKRCPRSLLGVDPTNASGLSKKSMESLATSTAQSIAPSLLPYVEDSGDESSAEFGTAIGLQLGAEQSSGASSRRPLPEIPEKRRSIEDSTSESCRCLETGSRDPISMDKCDCGKLSNGMCALRVWEAKSASPSDQRREDANDEFF